MPFSDNFTHRFNSVDELRALTDSELLETLLEADLGLLVGELDAFVGGLRDWPSYSKLLLQPSPPTSITRDEPILCGVPKVAPAA